MQGYLLDTNVLSELMKRRPAASVVGRLRDLAPDEIFTSAICVMELRFGAERHPRGASLWERIQTEIIPLVSVLPIGYDEAIRSGEILARLEAKGTPIGLEDVLIGSSALVHAFPSRHETSSTLLESRDYRSRAGGCDRAGASSGQDPWLPRHSAGVA